MKNKSQILNIVLAVIIVVLVFQLSKSSSDVTLNSTANIAHDTINYDTIEQVKRSVGIRGHIMPKPALVVGSYSADSVPNIMAAAWAGIVCSDPLSIGVSIRPSRKSYENIMHTKAFTINVPSAKFVAHVDYTGNISGKDVNKFEKLGLTPIHGEYVNAPYIKEFPIVIECEVIEVYDLGAHTQFIGKIIDTKVDAYLLNENNQVNIELLQPVIYEEEYYYGYGNRLARPWDAYKIFVDDKEPVGL